MNDSDPTNRNCSRRQVGLPCLDCQERRFAEQCPDTTPGVVDVNAECEITYSDGTIKLCEHAPPIVYTDCKIGYGPGRGCLKWDFHHLEGRKNLKPLIDADQDQRDQLTTRLEMRRDE